MGDFKSSKESLFSITQSTFEHSALALFRHQAQSNPIYHQYLANLGVDPVKIKSIYEIPFLPIEFFKTQKVVTGQWSEEKIFESSGTTGQQRSRHYIEDISFYHKVCQQVFEYFYQPIEEFHFLALLPSYLERENASLVAMMDYFIASSQSEFSGFYLHDYEKLVLTLNQLKKGKKRVLLIGVSFALLDLAENYVLDLENVTVMETGGMKGRREEMIRTELHSLLSNSFNTKHIHSEYGMTELMSQAYAKQNGRFKTPPWMKIILRDLNDPFHLQPYKKSGGINVIDLANFHSCAFIETQDIGSFGEDDTFQVLGRFDNSDIRGCNLMII